MDGSGAVDGDEPGNAVNFIQVLRPVRELLCESLLPEIRRTPANLGMLLMLAPWTDTPTLAASLAAVMRQRCGDSQSVREAAAATALCLLRSRPEDVLLPPSFGPHDHPAEEVERVSLLAVSALRQLLDADLWRSLLQQPTSATSPGLLMEQGLEGLLLVRKWHLRCPRDVPPLNDRRDRDRLAAAATALERLSTINNQVVRYHATLLLRVTQAALREPAETRAPSRTGSVLQPPATGDGVDDDDDDDADAKSGVSEDDDADSDAKVVERVDDVISSKADDIEGDDDAVDSDAVGDDVVDVVGTLADHPMQVSPKVAGIVGVEDAHTDTDTDAAADGDDEESKQGGRPAM